MRWNRLIVALFVSCSGLAASGAAAQAYPSKIIRMINPASPGGNSDIMFRLLSPKMGELLGQQFVIDYRPGAGGIIGSELTARSAPDGYTTAIAGAFFVINPSLGSKLPFDPIKDFTPLGLIVDLPTALVVHPSFPVKSVKELIAFAKPRPGQIFFSSSGAGALAHLAGGMLNSQAGIQLVHVPYKGAGPSVIGLVSGHVQLSFISVPAIIGFVQQGRLRMIAQGAPKRSTTLRSLGRMTSARSVGIFQAPRTQRRQPASAQSSVPRPSSPVASTWSGQPPSFSSAACSSSAHASWSASR